MSGQAEMTLVSIELSQLKFTFSLVILGSSQANSRWLHIQLSHDSLLSTELGEATIDPSPIETRSYQTQVKLSHPKPRSSTVSLGPMLSQLDLGPY